MFAKLRRYLRRRRYRPGAILIQWLAPDIRRDVEIVDASELDDGFVTAKIRTWNVLYSIRGLEEQPAFSEPRRVELRTLWQWNGQPWGGPVPTDDIGRRG